jgi:glycosyltransferase involved in cell wall biosynthesis
MNKPVILHATTGLHQGGAERVLAMLVTDPVLAGFRHVVYSLLDGGVVAHELETEGVLVVSAGMSRSGRGALNIASFISQSQSLNPVLIQGWMYHGNLLASTLGAFVSAPVVWGIHHTTLPATASWKARLTLSMSAAVSWVSPSSIVYCSESARQVHAGRSFGSRECVIANGIDTGRYCPSAPAKAAVRERLGIPQEAFVIGSVGRFDPQKDYLCLLQAAGERRSKGGAVSFVLCGKDLCWENAALVNWIRSMGLVNDTILLGPRADIAEVLNAFDVFTMSSQYGEALPLALLEAMSSGIPCVVTDVGDCAAVIARPDLIVPPRQPALLCRAWSRIEELDHAARKAIGEEMRERVIGRWGRGRMAREYRNLYENLIPAEVMQ